MATEYRLSYTAAEINEKLRKIDDCVLKNQGAENVGKILVVGTDGNLTLTDMPEGGASGDVIGVLDEANNILLSGNLADGTYTLKYENADGSYTEIGNLVVGDAGLTYTNWIEEAGYIANTRLSLSSGNETATTDYECTGFIPAKINDVIRVKNIDLTSDNSTNIVFYDGNKNPIICNGSYYGISLAYFFTLEANDVYKGTITGTKYDWTAPANTAYIRLGSKSITSNSILTVNEEIV